jgi:4-hydroxybenzoate polyprenyltransferase
VSYVKREYLELCRISNLPTVWGNVVAAYVVSGGSFSPVKFILLLLSFSMLYCGGMAMNEWIDADFDSRFRPDRPIPSGRIKLDDARNTWLTLFALALCFLYGAGGYVALCAGLVLLLFIVTYNLGHRLYPLTIIPMAGCRFMIYIITGIAAAGKPNLVLTLLAVAQFAYILYITRVSRKEQAAGENRSRVPLLLAGISLVDGLAMGLFVGIGWLAAGIAGGVMTWGAQGKIRGD